MRVKRILELGIDLAYPVQDTITGIHAVLNSLANKEDQINMMQSIKGEMDTLLKGVEVSGE